MTFSEETRKKYTQKIVDQNTSLDEIIGILEEIVKERNSELLNMFGEKFKRIKELSLKFPSQISELYSEYLSLGAPSICSMNSIFKEMQDALLDNYISQETPIKDEDIFLIIWMRCYDTKSKHFNDKALEAAEKLKKSPSFRDLAKEENLNKLLIGRFFNFWQIAWEFFKNHKEIFAESNYLNYMNNVKKCLEQKQIFEITEENLLFIFSDRYSVLDLMEKDLIKVEELCRKLEQFKAKNPKTSMEKDFDSIMGSYFDNRIFVILNIPFLEKEEKLELGRKTAGWNELDGKDVTNGVYENLNKLLKKKLEVNESSEYFLGLSKDQAQERLEKELSRLSSFYEYIPHRQEMEEPKKLFIEKSLSVIEKISHRTGFKELFSEELFEDLWSKHKALFWPVAKVMYKEYPSYFPKGKIKKYLKEVQKCLDKKKIFKITSENIEFLVTDLDSNLAKEGLLDILELRKRFENFEPSFKKELLQQGGNRLVLISDVNLIKDLVYQTNLALLRKLKVKIETIQFSAEFKRLRYILHENIARLFDQKTGETEKDIENKLGLKPKEIGKFDEVLNRSYFYEILYEILDKISFGYLHIPNKTETFNNMIDQLIDRSIDPDLAAKTPGPPEGNYTQSRNRNNNTLRPR